MNRQMKRAQKRQGTTVDRAQAATQARRAQQQQKKERTGVRQFLKEVRQELKKVNWPTRKELWSYFTVVLVSVVVLTVYVSGLDYVVAKAVLKIFG